MIRIKGIETAVLALAVAVMACSCTVTENLDMASPGRSITTVTCDDWFLDVLGDMASFGGGDGKTVMDETMGTVGGAVKEFDGTSGVVLYGNGKGTGYRMIADVRDFGKIAEEVGGGLVTYEKGKLSFLLNMDTYESLEKIVPALKTPELEVYGPRYSKGMSEKDYLDMMTFLLGDGAAEKIGSSWVELYVKVPGTVTKAVGAETVEADMVRMNLKLLDILLLSKPVEFSVEWK